MHTRPEAGGLPGAPNFRDIGGYPVEGGGSVRLRRVFRSGALARLDENAVDALGEVGIGLVYDLRGAAERARDVSRWPAQRIPETLAGLDAAGLEAVAFVGWRERLLEPDFDAAAARRWMHASYAAMPRLFAPVLRSLFERLAAPHAPITLIHCSAGKDRTGFVCAMLLSALGVSREQVLEDYLATRRHYAPEQLLTHLLGDELQRHGACARAALDVMVDVQVSYLDAAWKAIDTDYGGLRPYLAGACALEAGRHAALRTHLLD